MNIGMLYFNNDPKTDLKTKIEGAAEYYQNKYGKTPNRCFVHPSMMKKDDALPAGIEVRTSRSVMPNHFWIGVENVL